MSWRLRFLLREHVAEAQWIVPVVALTAAVAAGFRLPELNHLIRWRRIDWSPAATQTVLATVAGSRITFTGLVFSMILGGSVREHADDAAPAADHVPATVRQVVPRGLPVHLRPRPDGPPPDRGGLPGSVLFRVYGEGPAGPDEGALRRSVAVGPERTFKQDPRLAFRIIADIGARALSPGLNDPTTAVAAINHIHNLLGCVGRRCIGATRFRDASGEPRLHLRMPLWEDYVSLGIDEIRQFGQDSVQVVRRLRAMLAIGSPHDAGRP